MNYLYLFTRAYAKSVKTKYEPPIGINGANPEARFILDEDVIIDVEVKTPGFSEKIDDNRNCIGVIRPNSHLTNNQFAQIREYSLVNNIKCLSPDIVKLIGFLKDSIRKFQTPSHDKHYNLLFINWTYTETPIISYNEPISLLINNMSGILKNKLVQQTYGLTEEDLSKFSAIIIYFDNMESIITGDFRRLYLNNKFRIIINENIEQDWDTLLSILQLKNHREFVIRLYDDIGINMLDYSFGHEINIEQINRFGKDIYDIMFSDLDLYKGLLSQDFSECELKKYMELQRALVRKQFDMIKNDQIN